MYVLYIVNICPSAHEIKRDFGFLNFLFRKENINYPKNCVPGFPYFDRRKNKIYKLTFY